MTKGADKSDNMKGLFASVFNIDPGQKDAGSPAKRREAELKHRLAHDDGRRKRATGRTKQCNLKMNPADHARLVAESRERDVLMIVIIEEALAMYYAAKDKKGARV